MTATVDTADAALTAPPEARNSAGYTHRQIMTILGALLLGMFLAALDQTVVSTAIRTIGDDLHDLTAQAWVTTAFLITSTIATPLYGKLSDIYGRKPFFMAAISIFVLGSIACSFATSMYMLAGFRAFQGLGAGGLFTLALAIIGDIIPPRERAKYQGYFLAVFGTSSVLGPVIGGALAGQASILGFSGWRWIFLINVPIGIFALVVVYKVLHLPHVARQHRIDYWGALLLIVGLVPLLIVAEQGRTWGWGSGASFACYIVGVVALAAFVYAEKVAGDDALLPLRLFRNGVFAIGAGQSFIIGIGMFGGITLIPLWLQIVKGASPTKSGLLMLPLVLGIMSASILAGQITSRTGRYKIFPVIGSGLLVIGMLLLWRLHGDSSLVYADLSMLVVGAGLGLNMQTVVLAMQNAVSPRDIGVATASTTFFRQMGGTLGVAVFLSILYSALPSKLGEAFNAAKQTPAFQQAASTSSGQSALKTLQSQAAFNDTSILSKFPKALTAPWKQGFSSSMDVVFLVGAAVLVVAFVLASSMREVPLRLTAGIGSETPAEGAEAAAAVASESGAGADDSADAAVAAKRDSVQVDSAKSNAVQLDDHALDDHALDDHALDDHALDDHALDDHALVDGVDGAHLNGVELSVGDQPVGPDGGRHEVTPDRPVVTVAELLAQEEHAAHR